MNADDGQGRRIIIDSSFLRACPADGSLLLRLANRGDRLVLIDNLVYELCSTENRAQWPASQRKLMACPDAIECWEHTGVMLTHEAERAEAYGNPMCDDITRHFRTLLRSGNSYTPDDLAATTAAARQQREEESVPALFRASAACAACLPDLADRLRSQPLEQITDTCAEFVCNSENIRRWMRDGSSPCPFPAERVNEGWIAWHHYKATLAAICELLRQGSPSFENLAQPAQNRWINRKHDLDYLITLSRADAIATAETAGEMYHFCRWMYRDSKTLISPQTT